MDAAVAVNQATGQRLSRQDLSALSANTEEAYAAWDWPFEGEKPTWPSLEEAWKEHLLSERTAIVKAEAHRRISEKYPIWRQVNEMAAGRLEPMRVEIDAIRSASNTIEAQLAEMSPEDLKSFDPATAEWPA